MHLVTSGSKWASSFCSRAPSTSRCGGLSATTSTALGLPSGSSRASYESCRCQTLIILSSQLRIEDVPKASSMPSKSFSQGVRHCACEDSDPARSSRHTHCNEATRFQSTDLQRLQAHSLICGMLVQCRHSAICQRQQDELAIDLPGHRAVDSGKKELIRNEDRPTIAANA